MENSIRKNQDLGTGYAFCCVVASVHSILSVGGKTGKLEVHKWLFLAWNYIWWAFFKIATAVSVHQITDLGANRRSYHPLVPEQ